MAMCRQLLSVDDSEIDGELMALSLAEAFPDADIHRLAQPTMVPKICREQNFDCVLVDYNMPEVDGLTLARQLRVDDAHLPIVLVTNMGDDKLVAEAFRGGVSDYIAKSRINPQSIRRVVEGTIHSANQARVIEQQRGELENFAYALAHDFKQPIRQIVTFSRMLGEELGAHGSSGVRQHLNFLIHAATRLDKLVDVMQQYTLLNQPPELTGVNLTKVVASVRASLTTLLAERGGEFIAPANGPKILGNETLMIQVLQNLVVNGLHYNRSPTPRVEITATADAGVWTIDVRDNGIGIEPEYLTEIFKPLIRLHTTTEYAGSGLGLTLARKAIVAQGGELWCESTPGRGSTFHIRLAAAESSRRRPGKIVAAQ